MAKKSIEERLQRVQAFQEIQNIMGRYAYITMAQAQEERVALFAKKAPGVRVYFGEQGYFEGPEAPEKAWGGMSASMVEGGRDSRAGIMPIHAPICPVIEVAGDGKTAKGVWVGLGLLAMKNRETGEPTGAWEWDKYGVDFIKEDGKWKIWHFHIYRLLHGWGVDEKWTEQFKKPEPALGLKMDGPAVDDNPYRPDTIQRMVPRPPEPYETFDPKNIY
jgi:hypothetical protein